MPPGSPDPVRVRLHGRRGPPPLRRIVSGTRIGGKADAAREEQRYTPAWKDSLRTCRMKSTFIGQDIDAHSSLCPPKGDRSNPFRG